MKIRALVLAAAATAACGIDKAAAPALSGPSGFATSLELTASPDRLPRDGESTSRIGIRTFDAYGKPESRRVAVAASAGTLSTAEVTTDANGEASLLFTAPPVGTPVAWADIYATPFGTDATNAFLRSIRVALSGPPVPTPQFTVSPAAPARFQLATLDASASTIAGGPCTGCSFDWSFSDGASKSGVVIQHAFPTEGIHTVTLTVTASGVSAARQQTVSVGPPAAPTAAFTFSPTNPKVGDTVYFDGSASKGANGATIARYTWNFGNGQVKEATSPTTDTTYGAARSYNVTLTVTDSNGQTASAQQTITVNTP